MVSVTQTLTLIFGSAVTVPGTGVLLNDSMNLFDPQPGAANEIRPGKRPASGFVRPRNRPLSGLARGQFHQEVRAFGKLEEEGGIGGRTR